MIRIVLAFSVVRNKGQSQILTSWPTCCHVLSSLNYSDHLLYFLTLSIHTFGSYLYVKTLLTISKCENKASTYSPTPSTMLTFTRPS